MKKENTISAGAPGGEQKVVFFGKARRKALLKGVWGGVGKSGPYAPGRAAPRSAATPRRSAKKVQKKDQV